MRHSILLLSGSLALVANVAGAQSDRESLMPQRTVVQANAGTFDMSVDCLPITGTREIECVFLTLSIVPTVFNPAESGLLMGPDEASASAMRSLRAAGPQSELPSRAREALRRECEELAPDPQLPPLVRRARDGGYSNYAAKASLREAVCTAARTCSGRTCVDDYERAVRQQTEVANMPLTMCDVHADGQSVRMQSMGVDRWHGVILTDACGVESSVTIERIVDPNEPWPDADEFIRWRVIRDQRRARPAPDAACEPQLEPTQVFEPPEIGSAIAVQCDNVMYRFSGGRGFEERVDHAFISEPEWITRRNAACPIDPYVLDSTPAEDRRYNQCLERFMREERRRRGIR